MKKVVLGLSLLLAGFSNANAQAFEGKGATYVSVGIGGAGYWMLGSGYKYGYGYGYGWTPITGELNVQAEWGVHQYVGVGLFTGVGGGAYWGGGVVNVPIGAVANFHFYQLIADKTGKNIHADKLDIYAGANLGTGFGLWTFPNGDGTRSNYPAALIWGGPHAGIRYFFKENMAVNGEVGWGKTFINAGLTFKL